VLKTCTEIIERDRDPVIITKDRIMEVPYVIEKIVEKITIMPQIVEVLKYVHELAEEDNINILMDLDVEVNEYQKISSGLDRELEPFLDDLRRMKASSPQNASRIDGIERYVQLLRRYLKHPKLFEKIKEVKSDPIKEIVRVQASQSPEEARQELAKTLLIDQLISGIKEISADPKYKGIDLSRYLGPDVMSMFDIVFTGSVSQVNETLNNHLKGSSASMKSTKVRGGQPDDSQYRRFESSVLKKFS
jgi:hypothetical protein